MLLSVAIFVNAETNNEVNNNTEAICLMDSGTGGGFVVFKGVLDVWETPSGGLMIDCEPPFFNPCYTLIWWYTIDGVKLRKVELNDGNQTQIAVTSDPISVTNPDGSVTHTFTR